MKKIDLNCDMAELMPGLKTNFDQDIMPFVSSCNIACGFHSGSPQIIEQTILSAIEHHVKIGAHPSYNDPEHFGRRSIKIPIAELVPEWRYQISAIKGMVESLGGRLHHVKPHGSLYNDMAKDEKLASAFIQLVKDIDPSLAIYGLAGSKMKMASEEKEMRFVSEGFADRRYQNLTELRSRSLSGAVLHETDEVLEQIGHLISGKVILQSGEKVDLKVETICLHSDTPGAIKLSKSIYNFFHSKGVKIG